MYQNRNWGQDRGYGGRGSYDDRGYNRRDDGGRGRSYNRDYYDGEEMLSMNIPSKDVGKVIGRGGSKIRELQDESGANIKIKGESEYNSNETVVELKGSSDSLQRAKRLIEEFLAQMNYR